MKKRYGFCSRVKEEVLTPCGTQLDRFFKGPFTDKQGRLDYVKFAKTLKVNDADEVEQQQRRQD